MLHPTKLNCLDSPKKFLYLCLWLGCLGVSIYQLLGCIGKVRHPPVTTHYRFGLNETLNYPAVTICRNPPYKIEVLKKYNLGEMNSAMEEISQWEDFPFDKATLQKVWDEATYRQNEVLLMFGLHGIPDNVEIHRSFHYLKGQCFTLIPKIGENNPTPNSGWSVILGHDQIRNETIRKKTKRSTSLPGFHIFIHQAREPYYENVQQITSIMEYLYLEVGEELEIKLTPEQFNQIPTQKNPCMTDINYSASQCSEMKRWTNIIKEVGCIGPWMQGLYYPLCWNVDKLMKLLKAYLTFDDHYESCSRSCNSTAYKLFVVNRIDSEIPNMSNFMVYYTSKFVTVMEENPGYDWNSFLADIGGSFGFFLGISVVGAVGVVENVVNFVCGVGLGMKGGKKEEKKGGEGEKREEEEDKPPDYSVAYVSEKKYVA